MTINPAWKIQNSPDGSHMSMRVKIASYHLILLVLGWCLYPSLYSVPKIPPSEPSHTSTSQGLSLGCWRCGTGYGAPSTPAMIHSGPCSNGRWQKTQTICRVQVGSTNPWALKSSWSGGGLLKEWLDEWGSYTPLDSAGMGSTDLCKMFACVGCLQVSDVRSLSSYTDLVL